MTTEVSLFIGTGYDGKPSVYLDGRRIAGMEVNPNGRVLLDRTADLAGTRTVRRLEEALRACPWCGHPPMCHTGAEGGCVVAEPEGATR